MSGPLDGPLDGRTVLLTRDEGLGEEVRALGALVRVAEVVRYEAVPRPADGATIDASAFDWIVFTSARAVAYSGFPLDAGPRIACVGPATARAVEERGGRVDLVPDRHDAVALVEELIEMDTLADREILFPCSERALRTVEEALTRAGARVTRCETYRPRPAQALPEGVTAGVDIIVFLAPSAVEAFAALGGDLQAAPALAIGGGTAGALQERGVTPRVASTSDRAGLLAALRNWEFS